MKAEYSPEELLPLSGIQHFVFCRRQWALIHVERQWQENALTVEGKLLHQRADDPFFTETRNGVITARSVPVASYRRGWRACVTWSSSANRRRACVCRDARDCMRPRRWNISAAMKAGSMRRSAVVRPGHLLEEMLSAAIPCGYLYYGETRHRVAVELTGDLRELVRSMSEEMHAYFQKGYTPRVKPSKACRSCSLADICLPELQEKDMPASTYIKQEIERLNPDKPDLIYLCSSVVNLPITISQDHNDHEETCQRTLRHHPRSLPELDGENVVVKKDETTCMRLPLHNLENIVCFSYPGASPGLMGACAERNVGLCFLTPTMGVLRV